MRSLVYAPRVVYMHTHWHPSPKPRLYGSPRTSPAKPPQRSAYTCLVYGSPRSSQLQQAVWSHRVQPPFVDAYTPL
ncbi:hypothetical protein RSOLAG1IB_07197 [Rhizoctonia solani AG-1 IB]|uniref:Uncharacterized protein n=1 Tax=Thanatephorus cucumeris (strain AG1-IB / isolate 7/3/14) TaxID=1108050 RepID=A0A0B7FEK3_THACB|nr:hypothetical protein RSOLAG1IB_07197 [Rhizoctonia solani AG-1 IB]